jgi:hypothetical protein
MYLPSTEGIAHKGEANHDTCPVPPASPLAPALSAAPGPGSRKGQRCIF